MRRLAGEIAEVMIDESGSAEFLRRLSDPNWFQALSCVLGFDWHSSGTTTVTTGALKMALKPDRHGLAVAGGKGRTSSKAPEEIRRLGSAFSLPSARSEQLVRASRMSAKVDSALVQDGYRIYHHAFFFDKDGNWAVVQQGMNDEFARRYHWLSESVGSFVDEPHSAICCQRHEPSVMDLTARESEECRKTSLDLVRDEPSHLLGLSRQLKGQRSLLDFGVTAGRQEGMKEVFMPHRHELIVLLDIDEAGRRALQTAYELQPESYEDLVALKGMGPRRIRALSLISELIYGASPCWRDPARFSFAHGGKDGTPFPVDRETYDASIRTLEEALEEAKVDREDKRQALKRLCGHTGAVLCEDRRQTLFRN
jgi:hypothetical protein